jgi:hypothetical protein
LRKLNETENPFGTDANDLPLDICETVRSNIEDLIRLSPVSPWEDTEYKSSLISPVGTTIGISHLRRSHCNLRLSPVINLSRQQQTNYDRLLGRSDDRDENE